MFSFLALLKLVHEKDVTKNKIKNKEKEKLHFNMLITIQ